MQGMPVRAVCQLYFFGGKSNRSGFGLLVSPGAEKPGTIHESHEAARKEAPIFKLFSVLSWIVLFYLRLETLYSAGTAVGFIH